MENRREPMETSGHAWEAERKPKKKSMKTQAKQAMQNMRMCDLC